MLAGIRADGPCPPVAFPGACSRRPVAVSDRRAESGNRIRPLTVAGAAQVRLRRLAGSPSCFPLNCGM
ncbi:MAG: hypothetical protein OJF60_001793 [Burkholderiaceae bacterium]|nr:MAG: hypothetical protein OJF60_001793 [Burkholderiaceae bacterium]